MTQKLCNDLNSESITIELVEKIAKLIAELSKNGENKLRLKSIIFFGLNIYLNW